jgi:hypothetical protein
MSFSYSWTISDSLVMVTMEGYMDQAGALAIIESFSSDPAFRSELNICFDVRRNDHFPGYREVMSFSHEYRRRFQNKIRGKVAFIVESNIQYGVARMASTILSAALPEMDVFRSAEEGLQWLRT